MIRRHRQFAAAGGLALLVLGAAAPPAAAQNAAPERIGIFGDWGAFHNGSGNQKVCFVVSQPQDRQPEGLNRDPAFLYISFRPGVGVRNEVAITTGFAVADGSQPTASIGEQTFGLMAEGESAWLRNPAEESQFVQRARAGATLSVRATSRRRNNLTDVYSLSGLSQALDAAQRECRPG